MSVSTFPIYRRYVMVGERQVHVRYGGAGPLLVLLHQSPRSSAELEPLMQLLAHQFTVLAPDTPGNGLSDPLANRAPDAVDFADALAGLFDALAIRRAPIYGYHTGASIACAFAERHPGRVEVAILNGLAAFLPAEQDDLLRRYLPPFVPHWDGSHLTWLWSRMREQMIFFPWYATSGANRMPFDVAGPEGLTNAAIDFLSAGDNYRAPYRAALSMDARNRLSRMSVRTYVMASAMDPLYPHLARLETSIGDLVTIEELGSGPGKLAARMTEICLGGGMGTSATLHFPPEQVSEIPPAAVVARVVKDYIDVNGGIAHLYRVAHRPELPAVLLIHDLYEDASAWQGFVKGFLLRNVVVPDLPGYGESAPLDSAPSVDEYADWCRRLMASLGHSTFDVIGVGAGATVATRLIQESPDTVRRAVLISPRVQDVEANDEEKSLVQQIVNKEWSGSHLLKAWMLCRDDQLFRPWFKRTRGASITNTEQLHDDRVHLRARAVIKAGPQVLKYLNAISASPTDLNLKEIGSVKLATQVWESSSPEAIALPGAPADWPSAIAPHLTSLAVAAAQ